MSLEDVEELGQRVERLQRLQREDLMRELVESKAAGARFEDLPKKKAQAFSLVIAAIRAPSSGAVS